MNTNCDNMNTNCDNMNTNCDNMYTNCDNMYTNCSDDYIFKMALSFVLFLQSLQCTCLDENRPFDLLDPMFLQSSQCTCLDENRVFDLLHPKLQDIMNKYEGCTISAKIMFVKHSLLNKIGSIIVSINDYIIKYKIFIKHHYDMKSNNLDNFILKCEQDVSKFKQISELISELHATYLVYKGQSRVYIKNMK